jgi:hypothetical protein
MSLLLKKNHIVLSQAEIGVISGGATPLADLNFRIWSRG